MTTSFFDAIKEAGKNVMSAIPAPTDQFTVTGELYDGATTGGYTNIDGNYIRRSHGHAFMPHDEHKWFGRLSRYYRPAYYYPWYYPTYSYPYHVPYYHDYPTHKVIKEAPTVPEPKIYVQPTWGMNILVILAIVLVIRMLLMRR